MKANSLTLPVELQKQLWKYIMFSVLREMMCRLRFVNSDLDCYSNTELFQKYRIRPYLNISKSDWLCWEYVEKDLPEGEVQTSVFNSTIISFHNFYKLKEYAGKYVS